MAGDLLGSVSTLINLFFFLNLHKTKGDVKYVIGLGDISVREIFQLLNSCLRQ